MAFRFKGFKIYDEIRLYVSELYQVANSLPKDELFGLNSQLKRASSSILLNLAEGSMKGSDGEFRRFILISIGSVSEVVAILDICLDQKYIKASTHEKCMLKSELIAKRLYAFKKSLEH